MEHLSLIFSAIGCLGTIGIAISYIQKYLFRRKIHRLKWIDDKIEFFKSLESSSLNVLLFISRALLILLTGMATYLMMDWFPRTPEEAKVISTCKLVIAALLYMYGCFKIGELRQLKNYEKTLGNFYGEREKILIKLEKKGKKDR